MLHSNTDDTEMCFSQERTTDI